MSTSRGESLGPLLFIVVFVAIGAVVGVAVGWFLLILVSLGLAILQFGG